MTGGSDMEEFFTQLFLQLFHISISASYLILAVVFTRFLLRKAPKKYICILWLFVAIKLICPFTLESAFSLLPSEPIVEKEILYNAEPEIHTSIPVINQTVNQYLAQNFTAEPQNSINKIQLIVILSSYVWMVGIGIMLVYLIMSWHNVRRKVQESIPKETAGIKYYVCERIDSPFLFGLIRPKIYIPSGLRKEDLPYVLQHESAHKFRKDYLSKFVGFLLLAIYWFNPVIWLAYILLCRDIELACDERVIKELGWDYKKEYSQALLACAINHKTITSCPIAFGEIGVKQRVKNILQYKKPTFWVVALALLACIIIPICFMTQKKQETTKKETANEETVTVSQTTETNMTEEENNAEIEEMVKRWANAFVNRDGDIIYEMLSPEARTQMEERGLLLLGEDYKAFGWSSPWPWNDEPNYKILRLTDDTAEILYYAQTSDPHMWVWDEKINLASMNDTYVIKTEELQDTLYPCVAEEFYLLYPNGEISGTPMDYLASGAGEYLNTNALQNKNNEFYRKLFTPDTAAVYLLNVLDNQNKVGLEVTYPDEQSGDMKYPTAYVTFLFYEDGSTAKVTMIQPYGEDGIWIPQTYGKIETNYVYEEVDGEYNHA